MTPAAERRGLAEARRGQALASDPARRRQRADGLVAGDRAARERLPRRRTSAAAAIAHALGPQHARPPPRAPENTQVSALQRAERRCSDGGARGRGGQRGSAHAAGPRSRAGGRVPHRKGHQERCFPHHLLVTSDRRANTNRRMWHNRRTWHANVCRTRFFGHNPTTYARGS